MIARKSLRPCLHEIGRESDVKVYRQKKVLKWELPPTLAKVKSSSIVIVQYQYVYTMSLFYTKLVFYF